MQNIGKIGHRIRWIRKWEIVHKLQYRSWDTKESLNTKGDKEGYYTENNRREPAEYLGDREITLMDGGAVLENTLKWIFETRKYFIQTLVSECVKCITRYSLCIILGSKLASWKKYCSIQRNKNNFLGNIFFHDAIVRLILFL